MMYAVVCEPLGQSSTPRQEVPRPRPCENRVMSQIDPLAGRGNVETIVLGAYHSISDWT
jgi:hypothetical protein